MNPEKKCKAKKLKFKSVRGPYQAITCRVKGQNIVVVLLGTAHVSRESIKDVENMVQEFQPDAICVELCESRHESLLNPDRWKNLDITKVIKEKKIALLASNLILSSFQKKIGLQTGTIPGAEMLKASELAREKQIRLFLIDREIRTTLTRAWTQISFWNQLWLIHYLIASLLISEEITEKEIEELKTKDVLQDLFENIPSRYQKVKQIILDERDQYMAENIRRIIEGEYNVKEYSNKGNHGTIPAKKTQKKILVIVGAGHLKGISRYLLQGRTFSLKELNFVPEKKSIRTILGWIALSILAGIIAYFFIMGGKSAEELLLTWAISRSIGAGFGAIIAMAHPLTILVTIIMAPFSILIPGSRLWMFSALTEVWIHKPRVEDFERIAEDTKDWKSLLKALYSNRVLKLFWIISMVSFGLTLGNLAFLREFIEKILLHILKL